MQKGMQWRNEGEYLKNKIRSDIRVCIGWWSLIGISGFKTYLATGKICENVHLVLLPPADITLIVWQHLILKFPPDKYSVSYYFHFYS